VASNRARREKWRVVMMYLVEEKSYLSINRHIFR